MEASALHAPGARTRLPLGLPLLRLRSDEQLLALFRGGSEDAFGVIHDRYRQRLFAYVRQMLSAGSRQDAEDVLQDVFVRAYGALRSDRREVNLRAWLYRVAHNRCIDHLRRPVPPAAEVFEVSRKPLQDPLEEAQRREDLTRLVEDIGRLPDQQRSALLMREIDGMPYSDLSGALGVTVPAVKSLLVRARVGLVESAEARDADCAEIRRDLLGAYDRGVKCLRPRAPPHARLRRLPRVPHGAARHAALVRRAHARGRRPAARRRDREAARDRRAAAAARPRRRCGRDRRRRLPSARCKVAAVVCATALTAGGAVEMRNMTNASRDRSRGRPSGPSARPSAAPRPSPRRRSLLRPSRAPSRQAARTAAAPSAAPTTRTPAGERASSRREPVQQDEIPIATPLAPTPARRRPRTSRARRRCRAPRRHRTARRRSGRPGGAGHARAARRRRLSTPPQPGARPRRRPHAGPAPRPSRSRAARGR